jgi:hypothetical protein
VKNLVVKVESVMRFIWKLLILMTLPGLSSFVSALKGTLEKCVKIANLEGMALSVLVVQSKTHKSVQVTVSATWEKKVQVSVHVSTATIQKPTVSPNQIS